MASRTRLLVSAESSWGVCWANMIFMSYTMFTHDLWGGVLGVSHNFFLDIAIQLRRTYTKNITANLENGDKRLES